MWLNAFTTFDVGRCACSSSAVVVDSLSSSGDVPVALRIVVVRVDDDLARQRLHRNVAVVLQRHGDDDEVSGRRRLDGVAARAAAQLGHDRSASVSGPRELLMTTL